MAYAPTRLRAPTVATLAALTLAMQAGSLRAETPPLDDRREATLGIAADDGNDTAALLAARDRSLRAGAGLAVLKQVARPGHLLDPVPVGTRGSGLKALRADYFELERKTAGYRATLGERHPTLMAAEQVLTGLRTRMRDMLGRDLAAAERDDAQARGEVETIERRIRSRAAAEATGSIGVKSPTATQPAAAAVGLDPGPPDDAAPRLRGSDARSTASDLAVAGNTVAIPPAEPSWPLGAMAGILSLCGIAAGAAIVVRRRIRPVPVARVEPGVEASAPPREDATPSGSPTHTAAERPPAAAPVAREPNVMAPVASRTALPVVAPARPLALAEAGQRTDMRVTAGVEATLASVHATVADPALPLLAIPLHDAIDGEAAPVALLLTFAVPGGGRRTLLVGLDLGEDRRSITLHPALPRRLVARELASGPVYGVAAGGRLIALDPEGRDGDALLGRGLPAPFDRECQGAWTIETAEPFGAGTVLDASQQGRGGIVLVAGPPATAPLRPTTLEPAAQPLTSRALQQSAVREPALQIAAPVGLRPSFDPLHLRLGA